MLVIVLIFPKILHGQPNMCVNAYFNIFKKYFSPYLDYDKKQIFYFYINITKLSLNFFIIMLLITKIF